VDVQYDYEFDPADLPPDYGVDPRWDAYYDAMGHDSLWASPTPPWLPDNLAHWWACQPLLSHVWWHWLDPIRLAIAWWWYRRFHVYPTDADWRIDNA
jgi:hypothetical protein